MTNVTTIEGSAMPLPIENLDTNQIMPKQFLRIIGGFEQRLALRPSLR